VKLVENSQTTLELDKIYCQHWIRRFFEAAFGGDRALIQINEIDRGFVAEDEAAETVTIENKSEGSSYGLVNDYNRGQTSCFFTPLNVLVIS
jgi:hypothetical protein